MTPNIHCVIMGGGRGTRLQPLTKLRCKPAVPLAGKYRLVDIPISNCINSGFNQIYLLTQFNTASLHRHVQQSFQFDSFGKGFVEILSAEQTEKSEHWYQGTADAVRQNMHHFSYSENDLFLILSGDQLYSLDFRSLVAQHIDHQSDISIAAKPVDISQMSAFGCLSTDKNLSIKKFTEKPTPSKENKHLFLNKALQKKLNHSCKTPLTLASMGIYLFKAKTLEQALAIEGSDFGKEIIPGLLGKAKMDAYIFEGYWEDIGTIEAFFEANLKLTEAIPPFNFYDPEQPIYTRARHLPASKLNKCKAQDCLIAEGSIINHSQLRRCVIGIRSAIGKSKLKNVVMMGSDSYETLDEIQNNKQIKRPNLGIGDNCDIQNTIIDKNARIGNNVIIIPPKNKKPYETNGIYIRNGIACIPKGTIIADGTIIGNPAK